MGASQPQPPYSRDAADVAASLRSDSGAGLTAAEAAARLSQVGPNAIAREQPPSVWQVALAQLRDPMNIMLIAVTVVPLGDRTNMLFQNTAVTRGTASMVVTETGMQTQMGQIATMLSSVERTRSPLQRELGSLTKVLGIIAWGAVAFIVVVGVARGEEFKDVLLLGTAMAISAIPTGMPAFVSGLLSIGARQLADSRAVVKNLTDVETLGATSAINTDKTGTLTMNAMMVSMIYAAGAWFHVEGEGYRKTGAITAVAGQPVPDF